MEGKPYRNRAVAKTQPDEGIVVHLGVAESQGHCGWEKLYTTVAETITVSALGCLPFSTCDFPRGCACASSKPRSFSEGLRPSKRQGVLLVNPYGMD